MTLRRVACVRLLDSSYFLKNGKCSLREVARLFLRFGFGLALRFRHGGNLPRIPLSRNSKFKLTHYQNSMDSATRCCSSVTNLIAWWSLFLAEFLERGIGAQRVP